MAVVKGMPALAKSNEGKPAGVPRFTTAHLTPLTVEVPNRIDPIAKIKKQDRTPPGDDNARDPQSPTKPDHWQQVNQDQATVYGALGEQDQTSVPQEIRRNLSH